MVTKWIQQNFESLDYSYGEVALEHNNQSYEVFISPYSLGCDVVAELVSVTTAQELETKDFRGKLLLLSGDICAEQLMPKNFTFFNPDEHQKDHSHFRKQQTGWHHHRHRQESGTCWCVIPFSID